MKENIYFIGDSLFQLKLLLESIDEKLTFSLDKTWFRTKSENAISDLGNRYTPELNVKLEIAEVFEALGRTEYFERIQFSKFDTFFVKARKLKSIKSVDAQIEDVGSFIQDIYHQYSNSQVTGVETFPIEPIKCKLDDCLASLVKADDILWKLREQSGQDSQSRKASDDLSRAHHDLRELQSQCITLQEFLNSTAVRLINNPFFLLEGDAGIGKSHLLADVVKTRISNGAPSLLILGQHLTLEEPPWAQIFKNLEIKTTTDDFLDKMNLYGKHLGKRVIIFVDAINEGSGNLIWTDHINSFVDGIRQRSWLGLVLSIRSTYKGITISSEQSERNRFEGHKHVGFRNVGNDAVTMFFDNYKIDRPTTPLLNPEFQNPLFLRLFCEGIKKSGLSSIPAGLEGLTAIFSLFMDGVNKSLSSPKRYSYNASLNLVYKSVAALTEKKLELDKTYIPLEIAILSVMVKYSCSASKPH